MKPLIVANWKMYPTLADALVLAGSYSRFLEEVQGVDLVLAPPTSWLVPVAESLRPRPRGLSLAAQNVWTEDQGAYTGEVSSYLLKHIIKYVIVGHSERRVNQHESNELVANKVKSALRWELKPIICVGEPKHTSTSSVTHLSHELGECLEYVKPGQLDQVVVAYEPIWAVGTNRRATPDYVAAVVRGLKRYLNERFGPGAAEVRFLYGGSVNSESVADYLTHGEVSGLLVGRLSVEASEFKTLLRTAAKVNRS